MTTPPVSARTALPTFTCLAAAVLLAASSPTASVAQQTGDVAMSGLSVYVECAGRACDPAFLEQEIPWVIWSVTEDEADVSVSITGEPTATGGFEHTLSFTPSDGVGGGADELYYRALPDETEQEEIEGVANILGVGLARYATIQGYREFVAIRGATPSGVDPDERVVSSQEVDDPWDFWTFSVGANGNVNGSDTRKTTRLSGNFSARRTTPTWKLSFTGRGSIDKREIERSDGTILEVDDKDGTFSVGVTYTLADHWSLDLSSLTAKLPSFNQTIRADLTPGIEWSLFPYEEATRRSITVRYTMAATYRKYDQETIFGKTSEVPLEQGLRLAASMRQPWGDASATVVTSHFLRDIDLYNVSLRGNLSFRITRGLRLNVGGDISWVTDQVYLSARGVTDEEALLRLRTRRSQNNQGLNFGLSYQFGSIYNNTVNNRFVTVGGGGRGGPG